MDSDQSRFSSPPPPRRAPGWGFSFFQSFLAAGCAAIVVPFAMLLALVLLAAIVLAYSGVDQSTLDSLGDMGARTRVVRAGDADAGVIAIVSVQGAITGSGSALDGDGALARICGQLRLAREDDRVKAVLLQVDSPGGGLGASDQILREVVRMRESGRTVVAWAGDMMASGGYYVAVGAEGIMASPTATVGSIGVIMRHFQAAELLKKLGIEADPVVSAKHKDIGSMYREMTPEERELLQKYVDASHRKFVEAVAEGRGMSAEAVAALADGSIYTAEQALAKGMVDRIGYVDDAIDWLEEKTGEKNMRVIAFRRMLSLSDLFREIGYGAAGAAADRVAGQEASKLLAR